MQSPPTVSLRLARPNTYDINCYVSVVMACMHACHCTTYVGETDPGKVRLIIENTAVYIIIVNNEPGGIISYENNPLGIAHITEVATLPSLAGTGSGRAAFHDLMSGLQRRGFDQFALETHPDGPGLSLYQAFGFNIVDTIRDYHGTGQPRHIMIRKGQHELPPREKPRKAQT